MTNKMEDAVIAALAGTRLFVGQLHKRTSDFELLTYLTRKGHSYTGGTDTTKFWGNDDK